MKSLPRDAAVYKRTKEFSEATVSGSFLGRSHTTKAGVWARICVVDGSLRYRILEPELEQHVLTPEQPGVVEPQIPHEVEPIGEVRFFIEFLRTPK